MVQNNRINKKANSADGESYISPAFSPIVFWASIISFVATFYITIGKGYSQRSADVLFFDIFTAFYVIRIYFGLLMVTYDRSIRKAMAGATAWQKRNFYILFFSELFICLMVGYFFARFGDNAAAYIIIIESICLILFWINFYEEFLVKDSDRRSNWFTLTLDGVCLMAALLFLSREGISQYFALNQIQSEYYLMGSVFSFTIIVSIIFILEITFVYRESLVRFVAESKRVFVAGE